MENAKERITKQWREKPGRGLDVEIRKHPWNWELMKYYCYKEEVIFPNDLERLFSFEKPAGEERR
jgi:hypothetical protein